TGSARRRDRLGAGPPPGVAVGAGRRPQPGSASSDGLRIGARPRECPGSRDRAQPGRPAPPERPGAPGENEVHAAPGVRSGRGRGPGRQDRLDPATDRRRSNERGGVVDLHKVGEAAEAIAAASRIAMACHVGPDGDGLGSMLGLALAARRAGKEVWPSFGSPFELPDTFRYLPLDLLVPPDQVPAEVELFVAFDTGSPDRLGELGSVAKRADKVVVIDHHVTNEGFGDIAVVEPEVSSTAELTLAVIRQIGWPVTP